MSSRWDLGGIMLNPMPHEVREDDQLVDLTLMEFRILMALVLRPGRVFSREQTQLAESRSSHRLAEKAAPLSNDNIHIYNIFRIILRD